jgi:Kef-type K+ transport system membrane component KefB
MNNTDPTVPPPVPADDVVALQAYWDARDTAKKRKSGGELLMAAFLLTLIGVVLLLVGAVSTDAHGQHLPVSPFSVLIFVVAVVLAIIGFARRLLAAIENRNR